MNNIGRILILLFTLLLSFQGVANTTEQCGVEYTENSMIKEGDMELCEEDITANTYYYLFHRFIEDSELQEIYEEIFKPSLTTKAKASEIKESSYLYSLVKSGTHLFVSLTLIFLIVAFTKNIFQAQQNGNAFGSENGSFFKQSMTLFISIILIAPVDNITLSQHIVLLGGYLALSLSTFIWSNFLFNVDVETAGVLINDKDLALDASVNVEALITNQVCENRTRQQILNNNFGLNEGFNDSSFFDSYDMGAFAEKIENCMSYYVKPMFNKDASTYGVSAFFSKADFIEGFAFHRPSLKYCLEEIESEVCKDGLCEDGTINNIKGYLTEHEYLPEVYGQPHQCGNVVYNTTVYSEEFHDQDGIIESSKQLISGEKDVNDIVNNLRKAYSADKYFKTYQSVLAPKAKQVVIATGTDRHNAIQSYKSLLDNEANALAEKIINDITNDSNWQNRDSTFKANAINAQALGITNALLGLSANDDTEFRLDSDYENDYGILTLRNAAIEIADHLEKAHCSTNFRDLISSQKTKIELNNLLQDPDDQDIVKYVFGKLGQNGMSFECLNLDNSGGDYEFNYNSGGLSHLGLLTITERNVDGEDLKTYENKKLEIKDISFIEKVAQTDYINHLKQAYEKKLAMEGYYFIVKKASLIALSAALKDNKDDDLQLRFRQQGSGMAGAYLLHLANAGGNASAYASGIRSTASMSSFVSNTAGANFVNIDAFRVEGEDNKDQVAEKNMTNRTQLKPLMITGFFNQGGNIKFNSQNAFAQQFSEDEADTSLINNIIETLLLSPMNYIKETAGLSQDRTLVEGVKECAETDKICLSTKVHPLASFTKAGYAFIDQAITLYIAQGSLNFLQSYLSGVDSDSEAEKKKKKSKSKKIINGLKKVAKGATGVLLILEGVITIVAVIFDALAPLFHLMLVGGIFLAFILPLKPLLTYVVSMVSWFLTVITTLLVINIHILRFSLTDKNGNSQITIKDFANLLGVVLLKPSLLVLSAIIAFTLCSIVLYMLNMTMASFFVATDTSTGLMNIIIQFFMYATYVFAAIFLLMRCFNFIKEAPDFILQMIGIQGSNDIRYIDDSVKEEMLAAYIVHKGAGVVGETTNVATNAAKQKTNQNKYKTQLQKMKEEKAQQSQKENKKDK